MFSLVLLALAAGAADETGELAAARAAARTTARTAAHLAARHGAAFAVLAVSGPRSCAGGCSCAGKPSAPSPRPGGSPHKAMEGLLREVMPLGLTADVMYTVGFVPVEALKTLRILGADLLILGAMEGAGRCSNELFEANAGATALIAAVAPCPVLLVPAEAPAANGPYERILVAVDLAEDQENCRALLDFAAHLAAREGAELSVAYIVPPAGESVPPGTPRELTKARECLTELCHGLPGASRFRILAGAGETADEILRLGRERGAELLVLGIGADGGGVILAHALAGTRRSVLLVGPAVIAARKPAATAKSAKRLEKEEDSCRSAS